MNILYISTKKGWAGVVSWMVRTAIGLNNQGHNVFILSHPASELSRRAPSNVKLIKKRLGFDLNPLSILFLTKFIKNHSIDIVVTNIKKEVFFGGIAARICRIPNIRRIGTYSDLNKKIRWMQEKLVDHSIIPAQAVFKKAVVNEEWLKNGDFTTIYNGRNRYEFSVEDRIKLRADWGVESGDVILGSTSKLSKVKGIDRLIKVFYELQKKYNYIKLVITGEGQEREHLINQVRNLYITNAVIFNGFSEDPIHTAIGYDVAVLNSNLEGFPNSVVEYMAAGVPVVATNIDGVVEIIQHNKNGFLIDPNNNEQLYKALEKLIIDNKLRKQFSTEVLKSIEQDFSEDRMIIDLEKLFNRFIKND